MKVIRRYLIPLILLLVLIVGGAWLIFGLLGSPSTASLPVYTVGRKDLSATVRATGKVEPLRQINLAFRTSGFVKQVLVRPGDFVPAGTLLAELDNRQLQRNFDQAQSQLDVGRFNQSAGDERFSNAPTQTPAPNPTSTPVSSISDLYVGAVQAESAATQVASARLSLEDARIYAPFDGSILAVNIDEGEFINGIAPIFADLSQFQVRAEIDEIDIANVTIGQKVNLTLDAFPGRNFEGQVATVALAPNARQGTTVYSAVVRFVQRPNVAVRSGMAASLVITSSTKSNILTVPSRAVETVGTRRFVTVQLEDGRTEKVPVEVGLTNGADIEIVSGLSEGAKIVLGR
jgi:RND family efflux transporter MFP subunit